MALAATQYKNQNQNDMPRTPQQEYPQQGQLFNSSPLSSPKLMKDELDYSDQQPEPQLQVSPSKPKQTINKEKKQYSMGIYKWTEELVRKDKARKSSVSSENSQASIDDENN